MKEDQPSILNARKDIENKLDTCFQLFCCMLLTIYDNNSDLHHEPKPDLSKRQHNHMRSNTSDPGTSRVQTLTLSLTLTITKTVNLTLTLT